MISLSSPITITPPDCGGRASAPLTFSKIDYVVMYDNVHQSATAILKPTVQYLTLWNKTTTPTYDQAGQWTDSDVDARVNELLNTSGGNDAISAALLALYPKPAA